MTPIESITAAERQSLRKQLSGGVRGIRNARVIDAMLRVPRHAFVPDRLRSEAYEDRPLPIGHGQTISQPFVVAFMTEAIDPQPTDRALEVGSGCGYQTAVLAGLVEQVYSIEIVETLALQAAMKLDTLGYHNACVRHADGWFGWAEEAPFDAILIACSPGNIPWPLVEQLKPGGHMILPVGDPRNGQELLLIEKTGDEIRRESVLPVRFVPMTGRAELV